MLIAVVSVASCGGSGSKLETDDPDSGEFSRYTVSVPLVDNSTASAYKVLLNRDSIRISKNSQSGSHSRD